MSRKAAIVHIGITVKNIDVFIGFYQTYFGFEVKHRGVFPPEFIADAPTLYRLENGTYSDFAFLESPNGIVLELFQFSNMLPEEEPVWNRPGYHHICLKVENVPELYKVMAEAGVVFFFEPKQMGPSPDAHWVFLKDPDGNMIELQDTDL